MPVQNNFKTFETSLESEDQGKNKSPKSRLKKNKLSNTIYMKGMRQEYTKLKIKLRRNQSFSLTNPMIMQTPSLRKINPQSPITKSKFPNLPPLAMSHSTLKVRLFMP